MRSFRLVCKGLAAKPKEPRDPACSIKKDNFPAPEDETGRIDAFPTMRDEGEIRSPNASTSSNESPMKEMDTRESETGRLVPDAAERDESQTEQVRTISRQSDPKSTSELCNLRRVFGSVAFAALVAASVLTTVLTTKPGSTVWGYPLPFSEPSEPFDNTNLKRNPLHDPSPLRRTFGFKNDATKGVDAEVNRSEAEERSQDIEEESSERAVNNSVSKGGLVDLPVREARLNPLAEGSQTGEWQVMKGPVHVRRLPNFAAPALSIQAPGSTVVGRAQNKAWLRLAGGAGFIPIVFGGSKLLKQREGPRYKKIVNGSCADVGLSPILDARSCKDAALLLGLAAPDLLDESVRFLSESAGNDSMLQEDKAAVEEVSRRLVESSLNATDYASIVMANASLPEEASSPVGGNGSLVSADAEEPSDDGSKAEGCYIDALGALYMNIGNGVTLALSGLQPHKMGNGALVDKQPICAMPPTTSTITTTSTTSTTPTTTKSGEPSFMCFSYMKQWTVEEQLLKQQLLHGAGIFACDQAVVVSGARVHLGTNQNGTDVYTWENPPTTDAMGNLAIPGVTTTSWLNSLTFINAIDTILGDSKGRIWSTDFFVKVDPDAVLLPDRLRDHVRAHVGEPVYFLNCQQNGMAILFGAVEIFSRQAMELYHNGRDRCMDGLNWRGWGEDTFFASCLPMLGAQAVNDFSLVGDSRCGYAPCGDPSRAAFHPFKDVGSWVWCWRQATNTWD